MTMEYILTSLVNFTDNEDIMYPLWTTLVLLLRANTIAEVGYIQSTASL